MQTRLRNDKRVPDVQENELEALVVKIISEGNNWDIELLRQINSIVDPLYTADILGDPNSNINFEAEQVKSSNPKFSRDLDHFNTFEFDKFNSPLFLTHDSIEPKSSLKYQGGQTNSSTSHNIVKETQSYASLLQTKLPPSIPRPISIKNNKSIIRPTNAALNSKPRDHLDENTIPAQIHKMIQSEFRHSSFKYEDADNDCLSNFGWNNTQDIYDTDNFSDKSQKRVESTSRNSSRSSSAKSSSGYTTTTAPHFFPKEVGDLGGLGPDKKSDSYLLKAILI